MSSLSLSSNFFALIFALIFPITNSFLFESECEPLGYYPLIGDIPGWGRVGGVGGGTIVSSCHVCASYCDSQSSCKSYECSPTEKKCNLNTAQFPTQGKYRDYLFCVKSPNGKCPGIEVEDNYHSSAGGTYGRYFNYYNLDFERKTCTTSASSQLLDIYLPDGRAATIRKWNGYNTANVPGDAHGRIEPYGSWSTWSFQRGNCLRPRQNGNNPWYVYDVCFNRKVIKTTSGNNRCLNIKTGLNFWNRLQLYPCSYTLNEQYTYNSINKKMQIGNNLNMCLGMRSSDTILHSVYCNTNDAYLFDIEICNERPTTKGNTIYKIKRSGYNQCLGHYSTSVNLVSCTNPGSYSLTWQFAN